ncbi:Tat pathway signal protein [Amylibacter sp. IMCC11727]|uniref:Tat pathway signal protein n=1 Tax=Amylibacter sp. IMCC11727 TaxID=3039851 RepID=UPI00244D9EAC|nr:Tat pathway signal protein [Amylibacter sp. IMCC11727]WGI23046.1 Tat pathway signal protein [Amylibacter sp. IMCC11727]
MLTRRTFLATTAAVASVRAIPQVAKSPAPRRILTLVYDKALGGMRAIDKLVR